MAKKAKNFNFDEEIVNTTEALVQLHESEVDLMKLFATRIRELYILVYILVGIVIGGPLLLIVFVFTKAGISYILELYEKSPPDGQLNAILVVISLVLTSIISICFFYLGRKSRDKK